MSKSFRMKTSFFWINLIILAFAIYGTSDLALNEWEVGNICPKIWSIPACYIVWLGFSIAAIVHIFPFQKATWFYFTAIGLVTLIALSGTIGELSGYLKCPRTSNGIPMCFISLGICTSLILTKVLLIFR